jgi:predicted RNA-binding protein with PIN domain
VRRACAAAITVNAVPSDAPVVVLVDEARRQVIEIAAQVVGGMPAEDVPASLRPIARFTAAKRIRLGGPALAAAVESNPDFRQRLAELVSQTSPDLVAAIGSGEIPAAAEPGDVITVAYLVRPEGWQSIIAAATPAESGQSDEEVERLRAELADLRRSMRAEADRRRDALGEAQAQADAAARELRSARAEARSLRAELEAARADVLAARDDAARVERRREQEVRRVRGQLAEAERSVEAARRSIRTERSGERTRAALLVDSIAAAAAGLRDELELPATSARPADGVAARSSAAGVGGAPTGPRQLDELLGLPRAHLIVDGYNVTKTGYGDLPLAAQRTRLVGELAALASARPDLEVTVAFDGAAEPLVAVRAPRGVRVLFSAADEIADALIARLVEAEPVGRTVVVVSSDGEVAAHARSRGAQAAASQLLLDRLAQLR